MPVIMVGVVCVAAILLFNMVVVNFVDTQVKESMQAFKEYHQAMDAYTDELNALDPRDPAMYSKREKIESEMTLCEESFAKTEYTVPTQMVSLDDQEYIQEFATAEEKALIQEYMLHQEEVAKDVNYDAHLDEGVYRISTAKLKMRDDGERTNVLVYTNLSSLNGFIRSVNRVLIIIVSISAGLSIILGLVMTKNFTDALIHVREFVERLRDGGAKPEKKELRYKEFVQLANHVEELSDELYASQKLQKLIFQNASHELRTPLMSIQGYAEGISTNVLKNHQSAADIIITESKKMSELVDEMLFISRMDEQQLTEEDMTVMELRQIIEDCREEICVIGEKKGVVVIESLDGGNYFIKGEEKQITKALSNVMSNGIRYAEEKLAITGTVADGQIVISISDDGKGISENDLPHIFERFYKGEGGNFGIGLSITKDIIERHGGQIRAENNSTKGAKFTITLPAIAVETTDEKKEIGSGITTADDAMLKAVIDSIPEEDRLI